MSRLMENKKDPQENLMDTLLSYFVSQDPQDKKNSLPPKAHFSIWYSVMALFLISYLQQYYLSKKVETISYSQFKQYVAEGSLSNLTIGPETINGTLKGKDKQPDEEFIMVRVDDPRLVTDLDGHKVSYSGHYESKFLNDRRTVLDKLAHLLSRTEVVTGAELRKMLGKSPEKPSTVPQAS